MSRVQYRLLGIGLAGVVISFVVFFGTGSEHDQEPAPALVSEQRGNHSDSLADWMSSWGRPSDALAVERVVRMIYAAYNERNLDAFLAGWTDMGFARVFRFPKARAVNRLFAGFKPVIVGEFSNTVVTEKGASTEVVLTYGQVEELHRLSLVKEASRWLIDNDEKRDPTVSDLARRGGAQIMDVALGTGGIQFDASKAAAGTMLFKIANTDTRPHEFIVMKWLPDSDMEQSIGTTGTLQPGASATLILSDLTPGRYVILCNMPSPDGVPYSSTGMRTEFIIQ